MDKISALAYFVAVSDCAQGGKLMRRIRSRVLELIILLILLLGTGTVAHADEPPGVSLEKEDGQWLIVVDGRVSEITFSSDPDDERPLQVLDREPDADGKTRIAMPAILPNEDGEIFFSFTQNGRRFQVKIKVTYGQGGTVTYGILTGPYLVAKGTEDPCNDIPAADCAKFSCAGGVGDCTMVDLSCTCVALAAAPSIPTVSGWGVIILATLLAMFHYPT
jgi:hypothetical protein